VGVRTPCDPPWDPLVVYTGLLASQYLITVSVSRLQSHVDRVLMFDVCSFGCCELEHNPVSRHSCWLL